MAHKLKLHSPVGADPLILKWPVPTSEGKDGPEEILDTIRLVCEDYPELKTPLETRILKDGEDVSNYDYEETKSMCERYNKAIDSLRHLVKGHPRQKTVSKQASMKQLKHILQQCYNHSVKDPEKLNHYEPFSPEVYGETSFELVEQMINYVKFSETDYFIDLGSGVGQVVLQVSAATNCKFCYGVEKAEWPAEYAVGMEKEFRRWMKWYGKDHGDFKIEKGDFLHDGVKEKLSKATIVFVNNFAFGPQVDHELKQRFANCLKEGARIVSSKAFCPLNFRITARNLSDIGTIMQVEELSPLCGAVSWTGKPFAYYVHTIDRTLLEKYFQRLRYPSKKDEIEPRKDRKGRPLLSIRDKINGALSGGSDSNSSGRWRHVKGLQRETGTVSPLTAAKMLDFDSCSNSSFTNNGSLPVQEETSIVYGPTTRRQWNEYVKRPQSQSGSENENDSSAADVASLEVKTKDQAKQITQKKKKMKTMKRLNNGALGKRQMQVGKKAEPLSPVKSKAAVKLRPRQKPIARSSTPRRTSSASVASAAASISTTTSTVSNNLTAHTNSTPLPPSLDSLNLLHAHTIMSTSGKDPAEKVNYNDRRMTETSNAYFKPTVQKQTVSMLEKEAGFLQMIDTMKQRFLSFLTFMQTPEYKAMLLLQIEQEKRKNSSLKNQTESLEKDISILQRDGVKLIKDRLKEMGIKADTPRELISQAKDIMLRHRELKSQTASLGAQINALQAEHNHKVTAYRKVLDRKLALRQSENGFCEHPYHMMDKDNLDQHRLLANVNRLHTELQHLQNVNKPYVARPEAGNMATNSANTGSGVSLEGKGAVKDIPGHPTIDLCTVKEKLDMKENYDAFGTVLTMVKKEVTAALKSSSASQAGGPVTKPETVHTSEAQSVTMRQDTADKAPTVSVDLKSNGSVWSAKDASTQSSSVQSPKALETSTKEAAGRDSHISQILSSWTSDVRKDGTVVSTSPRILPPGMKIDIKKQSRLNGLNTALKAKVCHPSSYTILQNPDTYLNQSYQMSAGGAFNTVPTFNVYTENEKSAAEDLISLKESLSTHTTSLEPQSSLINKAPVSSLSGMEQASDSRMSNITHSSHDNKTLILAPSKPHTGSSNSLSKDLSFPCAIAPASSTSHVFAQVPVANPTQPGSNQNKQTVSTAASKQVRPIHNQVKIVTSLPKNGLVKHKNFDTSIIQPPVKVRTVEANSTLATLRAQTPQQAHIVSAPSSLGQTSGTSLTHVLRSDSGHFMSNQSFLTAHTNQTVMVSSGSNSTVGSASLPFVTIQSPHAIPISHGNNGLQPSLLKILQQKPVVISPKSSTVLNGTASGSSSNAAGLVTSQASLSQVDSVGQAVKILPPRDTKGRLHSPEPCSPVMSEFGAYLPVTSPAQESGHIFQEPEHQALFSASECSSDTSEGVVQLNACSHGEVHCDRKRQECFCYSVKTYKHQDNLPPKISKLSPDSDVSSSEDITQAAIARPTTLQGLEARMVKQTEGTPQRRYSNNNPAVILKREANLERMAEGISESDIRRDAVTSTLTGLALLEQGYHSFESKALTACSSHSQDMSMDQVSHSSQSTSHNQLCCSLQGTCLDHIHGTDPDHMSPQLAPDTSTVNEDHVTDRGMPSRKRKYKECQVVCKKASAETKCLPITSPQNETESTADAEDSLLIPDQSAKLGLCDSRTKYHRSRKDDKHNSRSCRPHHSSCRPHHSSCRNKIDVRHESKGGDISTDKIVRRGALVPEHSRTGSSSRRSSHAHSISSSSRTDQKGAPTKEDTPQVTSGDHTLNPKSHGRSSRDKYSKDSNLQKRGDHHCSHTVSRGHQNLLIQRSSVSPKLRKLSSSNSPRSVPEKISFSQAGSHCSSSQSETDKQAKHASTKDYKKHSTNKHSNSSETGHSRERSDSSKTRSSRESKERKRSSHSRSPTFDGRVGSSRGTRNDSSSVEKDTSPGPPVLERAVSPPSNQSNMSRPNIDLIESTVSGLHLTRSDRVSKLGKHSDNFCSKNEHRPTRPDVCSSHKEKISSKCTSQSKETSVPHKLSHHRKKSTQCGSNSRESSLSHRSNFDQRKTSQENLNGKTSKYHSQSREPSLSPKPDKGERSKCHSQSVETSLSPKPESCKEKASKCHSQSRELSLSPKPDKGKTSKGHSQSREPSLSPKPESCKEKTSKCHSQSVETSLSPKPESYKEKTSKCYSHSRKPLLSSKPQSHKEKTKCHNQSREPLLSPKPENLKEKTSKCHSHSREPTLSYKQENHKEKTSKCHSQSRELSLSPKPESYRGKTSKCYSQSGEPSMSPKPEGHKGKTSKCHSQPREPSLSLISCNINPRKAEMKLVSSRTIHSESNCFEASSERTVDYIRSQTSDGSHDKAMTSESKVTCSSKGIVTSESSCVAEIGKPLVKHSKRHGQSGISIFSSSGSPEDLLQNELEPNKDTNLDSPYGLLTPRSVSWSCQMDEEGKKTDSCEDEGEVRLDITPHPQEQAALDVVPTSDTFEAHAVSSLAEPESFPFPPTPGKTPCSASVPGSPVTDMTTSISEEPNDSAGEAKPSDPLNIISARKGPRTPPGSPLFNHESQSRSRSASVSSSSSRGSSYDTCTSSSSSCSDSSSDGTKKSKRRRWPHHMTPPRKLSTLITSANPGMGSPSKATVLYSPMPSLNMNGFNYGLVRLGLGPGSTPAFNNHNVVAGSSVLSPLSVSTGQSPGYQMVTSDSLRSPNGLLRSPLSGGLVRQHPHFPKTSLSPISSTASSLSASSSQGYNVLKTDFVQPCKLMNSTETVVDNKTTWTAASHLARDKIENLLPAVAKSLPVSTTRLSAVALDPHSKDLEVSLFKTVKSSLPDSSYQTVDSSNIVKDHNANNTTLSCAHSPHTQGSLPGTDYNQNLFQISTSCALSTLASTPTAIVGTKQKVALDVASVCCNTTADSKLRSSVSDMKNVSHLAPASSHGSLDNLVMEKGPHEPQGLPLFEMPAASCCSKTLTQSGCTSTDPLTRNVAGGHSENKYMPCSLQQQQVQYLSMTAENRLPSTAEQTHQPSHLPQKKQQSQTSQPLHHMPLFHQANSPPPPPPLPGHLLHMQRLTRQKSPSYPARGNHYISHPNLSNKGHSIGSHYITHPNHANKGHNIVNRRGGFGSRFPLPHNVVHWGQVSSQSYHIPCSQSGPSAVNKPRHLQPAGSPSFLRGTGEAGLQEHIQNGMLDYTIQGSVTKPYGTGQWDRPGPSVCMGSGPGGLGRSFHQQNYNHPYHNKHHH